MRLLLDTHIFLWTLAFPERLDPRAREVVSDVRNALLVSSASLWELGIKYALGKIALPQGPAALWAEAQPLFGFQELPVTAEHALTAGALPPHHRDPFDRMLVAQSRCEGLTLVTADRALVPYGIELLLVNRME